MNFDVIVFGNCFVDLVFGQVPEIPRLGEEVYANSFCMTGGGYFIAAVALARLGLKVGIVTRLGTDDFSKLLKRELEAEGVSTDLIYQVPESYANVTAVMSQKRDRAFLSHVTNTFQREFVEHGIQMLQAHSTKALHISALPYVMPVVQAARDRHVFVTMDVAWNPAWFNEASFQQLIRLSDLFIPNQKEALVISKASTIELAVQWLKARVPNVIVKCGSSGCMYQSENEASPVPVPATPAELIVDTTGAGDNFDAGVLMGLLDGQSYFNSCMLGNYCGKESLKGLGGTATSSTRQQVHTYFRETYGWTIMNQPIEGVS